MMANSSIGTICSADPLPVTPTDDGYSWLDYICLTCYLVWLTVVIGVMATEWLMRKRGLPGISSRTSQGANRLARISSGLTPGRSSSRVIWLPLLVGILPSSLTILWVLSTPRSPTLYTKSQATIEFLESCSDPTAVNFTSRGAYHDFFVACDAVQNRMNADIGGIGIRISLYVSLVVTIFSSLGGHFHQEKTAVKDIGTAQLASMLSITFALLRSYTALNFWQLMVAVMSLEITSATVQISLSQKETLASRWWVLLNSVSQLLVQISLATVLGMSFPMSSALQDPCQPCVRAVWWGIFDSCKNVPWTFWIYLTMRTLIVIRSCAIGLHHMHYYDLSERIARGEKATTRISWSNFLLRYLTLTNPVRSMTIVDSQPARTTKVWSLETFHRMPATTLTDWILWVLPALVAMSSMERMLSLFDLSKPGSITDWGQTTTFMAVIFGLVARSVYLFYAKLKRRSCWERTKSALKLSKSPIAGKTNPIAEDFATLRSKWQSFRDIRRVLEPVDCVRWTSPDQVWYEHIDLDKVEKDFLESARMNDVKGLIDFARYIPDISMAVDNDMKRTALHIALDNNSIEAIETIMELMDQKLPLEGPSSFPKKDLVKLLKTRDKIKRTPWDMIMPREPSQMQPEVLEAFLRFKHPVRPLGQYLSSPQSVKMVFTLDYSLEIMKAWVKAAEETHSLKHLEDNIIEAVETENLPLSDWRIHGGIPTEEIKQVTEAVYEFCCWQYDDVGRIEFADRLFRAFIHSPLRNIIPMPTLIAGRLARFVQERRAWAVKSYTEITRLVVWKCVESLDPIRILLEQHPKDQQFEEQIVVGVILNLKLGIEIMDMMWKEWPDQVAVTPKVLEACLVDKGDTTGSYCLTLLLRKCPHQIQITESILQHVARKPDCRTWEVLIGEYQTQINMTQDIFHTSLRNLNDRRESVNSLLRNLLRMWPTETRITNETLLIIMREVALSIDVIVLFSKVRHREFGAAIDGEVLVALVERGAFRTLNFRSRTLVDFFFKRYPDECRASITDEVLSKIENMKDGHAIAEYFDAFRQGLINDLTIALDVRPKFLNIDRTKNVGRRTTDAVYGWNGLTGRHGIF